VISDGVAVSSWFCVLEVFRFGLGVRGFWFAPTNRERQTETKTENVKAKTRNEQAGNAYCSVPRSGRQTSYELVGGRHLIRTNPSPPADLTRKNQAIHPG